MRVDMVIVTDINGTAHVYEGGEFHTEDITNNLVIECDDRYVVFADGKWIAAEKDARNG